MCVPALPLSVPTAVFLRLSRLTLPPCAQAFVLACVLQVGVFNHWAQCLSSAALTLTFLQHLC